MYLFYSFSLSCLFEVCNMREIFRCFHRIIKWKWWFIHETLSMRKKFKTFSCLDSKMNKIRKKNNKINSKSRLLSSDKAKIVQDEEWNFPILCNFIFSRRGWNEIWEKYKKNVFKVKFNDIRYLNDLIF